MKSMPKFRANEENKAVLRMKFALDYLMPRNQVVGLILLRKIRYMYNNNNKSRKIHLTLTLNPNPNYRFYQVKLENYCTNITLDMNRPHKVTRRSATAERQRVSYTRLSRLTH